MKKDEDNRMDKYQAMDDKCGSVLARIAASMSFSHSEIMKPTSIRYWDTSRRTWPCPV